MKRCEQLSDRMVEVLHRGKPWTDEESRHLAQCPDCAAEWKVVARAADLGAGRPPLDADRIARVVKNRLAGSGPDRRVAFSRRVVSRWALGLAAAAALVLAIGRRVPPERAASPPPASAGAGRTQAVLTELDQLSLPELESVWRQWQADEADPAGAAAGLGDLTPDELERILRSWEG